MNLEASRIRPDSTAFGMFSFQYCVGKSYCQEHIIILDSLGKLQHTYLDCISYDSLAVLDSEAELRVMLGKN